MSPEKHPVVFQTTHDYPQKNTFNQELKLINTADQTCFERYHYYSDDWNWVFEVKADFCH